MIFIAIANGAVRQLGYGKVMSELSAHQIFCITGITLFFLYTFFLGRLWPLEKPGQARMVGVIWLMLTVAFEFIFGHYAAHQPWSRLFHDYNILAGRLWSLVLVVVAILPYAVYRMRSRQGETADAKTRR